MINPRPEGVVTVSGITTADGRAVSTQQAVEYGWIVPADCSTGGWGIERHEIPVGSNLFLDQGRQAIAFAFGGRSPMTDYAVKYFAVGTGRTSARITDVALEAPIYIDSAADYKKEIDAVDYLSPFIVRVAFTLGTNDANGYGITELGLLTGGGALIARKIRSVVINKTSDYSPTLTWRLRF